jgi:hypothetical protein
LPDTEAAKDGFCKIRIFHSGWHMKLICLRSEEMLTVFNPNECEKPAEQLNVLNPDKIENPRYGD